MSFIKSYFDLQEGLNRPSPTADNIGDNLADLPQQTFVGFEFRRGYMLFVRREAFEVVEDAWRQAGFIVHTETGEGLAIDVQSSALLAGKVQTFLHMDTVGPAVGTYPDFVSRA